MSTKLSKGDFDKFRGMRNRDGQWVSEQLRELIKMNIEVYEDGLEFEESKIIVELVSEELMPITYSKILDDDENITGTFQEKSLESNLCIFYYILASRLKAQ
ncbi:MAG: hypothetical protein OEL52_05015 [Nitrosopumilus sp.]|nr:hypothetical protein [Nitrosopumilus sp.]